MGRDKGGREEAFARKKENGADGEHFIK